MEEPYNRTHIKWPSHKRCLVITCCILFIIAVIVISITIPVTLTHRSDHTTQSAVDLTPSFNVTYLLVDPSTRSTTEINLDSIDRVKMAHSFENGLGLNLKNILYIRNIFLNIAVGTNSKSRRKRFVQCNGDSSEMSGPVLIVDFGLTYPINETCQSNKCINQTFEEIYQRFQSVRSLAIDFGNVSRALRLCSFGTSAYSGVEPTVSNTQNFTTASPTNQGLNRTVSSTRIPTVDISSSTTHISSTVPSNLNASSSTVNILSTGTPNVTRSSSSTTTMGISSTRAPNVTRSSSSTTNMGISPTDRPNVTTSSSTTMGMSSTAIPDVNASSSTVNISSTGAPNVTRSLSTTTMGISSTVISDVNVSSTMSISSTETSTTTVLSSTETISATESSNLTLNETNVDMDLCLRKLPITQEQVPPYRITYTSTLFFQDDRSLVVVGASKFETFIEMQTLKREIIINGVMVYTNCQRTLDVSLPVIYHSDF